MATTAEPGAFPVYSRGERLADLCVHAVGVPAGLAGAAALLAWTVLTGTAAAVACAAVYAAGLVAMLALSAAYNLARRPRLKERLRRLDHAAIFAMIAGTYTPFAALALGGAAGAGLLAVVWPAAAAGMAVKLFWPRRLERLSITLYLVLGWSALAVAGPLVEALPGPVLALLAAGGVAYTVGAVLHLSERLAYHNALWHACVLAAAACHYAAVWLVVAAPAPA